MSPKKRGKSRIGKACRHVFVREMFGCYRDFISVRELHHGLGDLRRADDVVIAGWTNRIESEASENVPRRHLAAIKP
jgi:hypothetical protein